MQRVYGAMHQIDEAADYYLTIIRGGKNTKIFVVHMYVQGGSYKCITSMCAKIGKV